MSSSVDTTNGVQSLDSILCSMKQFVELMEGEIQRNRRPRGSETMNAKAANTRHWLERLERVPQVPDAPSTDAVAAARRVLVFISSWEGGPVVSWHGPGLVPAQLEYEDLLFLVDAVYKRAEITE